MPSQTLFGEVALKLSSHPENIATEALCHILNRHARAWPALRGYLGQSGVELPDVLAFRTQDWGDDSAIPDLVGCAPDGTTPLIVEAKFWAGLTQSQPVTYLNRLPSDRIGLLLFIIPGMRLAGLWDKIAGLSAAAGFVPHKQRDVAPEYRFARLSSGQCLSLVSWRAMLGIMAQAAQSSGDAPLLSDVEQLLGLCEAMDGTAFLPLTPAELGPAIGRRVQQLADLVDSVVYELASKCGASTKGLTTGGSQSTYGRYFLLKDLGCFFAFSPQLWARGETPMWLQVAAVEGKNWTDSPRIRDILQRKFATLPSRLVLNDGSPWIAIDVPTGLEQHDVITRMTADIDDVVGACRDAVPL